MMDEKAAEDIVILGHISGIFGVQGWVKVFSDTRPRENILNYKRWLLRPEGKSSAEWVTYNLKGGRKQSKSVVAGLQGIDDREQARSLIGHEIAVYRHQLPKAASDEVYWSDLIGLKVITIDGDELGRVSHLFETGANDVLVVKGDKEYLLPFTGKPVIDDIDLDNGLIRVDWDKDF